MPNDVADAGGAAAEETQTTETGEQTASLVGGAQASATEAGETETEKTWYGDLPETLRENPNIAKFHSGGLEALALAHVNSVGLHGVASDKLAKVPEAADAGGIREYLARLGAASTRDDFKLANTLDSGGAELGEGFTADGPLAVAFADGCFEASLPAGVMQPVFDKCVMALKAVNEQHQATLQVSRENNVQELRETLGPAFEDTIRQADYVATELGIMDALVDADVGTNPKVVTALAGLASIYSESSGLGKLPVSMGGTQSKAELVAKARELEQATIDMPANDGRKREMLMQALKLREQAS